MGAIREAHERCGYRVIGLAPTNTVAQDLRAASGAGIAQTSTVHLALLRQEKGREPAWDDRTALLVDGGETVSFDPAKFDQWGHGYAGTVYRGQGKTQLEVLALYDNPAGWNARAAYVGMTRHKAEVRLYVGRDMAANREVLARRMSRADDVGAVKPQIGASTVVKAPDPWAALDLSGASAAVERAVQAGRKPEPAAAHKKSRAAFERCLRDIAALTEDGLVAPSSMVEDRKRLYETFRSPPSHSPPICGRTS